MGVVVAAYIFSVNSTPMSSTDPFISSELGFILNISLLSQLMGLSSLLWAISSSIGKLSAFRHKMY